METSAARSTLGELEVINVRQILAAFKSRVDLESQHVRSTGEAHAALAGGLVGGPTAGVVEGDRPGFVLTIDLKVDRSAGASGGIKCADLVGAGVGKFKGDLK